jgi:AcrR family transcriptional regulator
MARPRSIPDSEIFVAVRRLLGQHGDRGVSFASVAQASGLSAPSLAQRYGSRSRMIVDALAAGWQDLSATTEQADAAAAPSAKGAAAFLKAIEASSDDLGRDMLVLISGFRDPALQTRAAAWQRAVVTGLAMRLGKGGSPDVDAGESMFAMWQGRLIWSAVSAPGFKMKRVMRRVAAHRR